MLFINHRSFAGGVENEIGIVVSGFASEKPARCDRSCSDDVAPSKLCVEPISAGPEFGGFENRSAYVVQRSS